VNQSPGSLYEHKRKLKAILAQRLPMHGARVSCLSMLLLAIVQEKTVNLVSLSLAFQGNAQPESCYRRIKRFLREVRLEQKQVAKLIVRLLPAPPYTVCIDRTNWQFGKTDINIMVIGIAHRGVAFPIVWMVLDKAGNSTMDERIDLLKDFLEVVSAKNIAFLLADREFIGDTWMNYLDKRKIPFAIRVRHNALCDDWLNVSVLFADVAEGELKILQHAYRVYGCTVRLVGMKLGHNDYLIIATNHSPSKAFLAYKIRWSIEMLFSAIKKTGFNLEATHLTETSKLMTLFSLLALAFSWAHMVGVWLHESSTKPLKRKAHLRLEKSFFRHGLDYLRSLLKNLPRKNNQLLSCISFLSCT